MNGNGQVLTGSLLKNTSNRESVALKKHKLSKRGVQAPLTECHGNLSPLTLMNWMTFHAG